MTDGELDHSTATSFYRPFLQRRPIHIAALIFTHHAFLLCFVSLRGRDCRQRRSLLSLFISMKHFSCQPDSHNAFGSLTNGVLTYFTVDCARYRRVAANGIGDVAELHTHATGGDATVAGSAPSQWSGQQPFAASSSSTSQSAGHGATQQDVHFNTETRMHLQRTLTLPSPFQGTQCFFSMANRTVFGTDMAFIGAANGLLALAVLQEDLLLYVRGKDPQSLREQLHREHAGSSSILRRGSASLASIAASDSGVIARQPPSPQAVSLTLPSPSHGQGGGGVPLSSPSFVGSAAAAARTSRSSSFFQGRDPSSSAAASAPLSPQGGQGVVRGLYRRDAPSTITWMRNKPLVLVGYTSGWVEWYEVSISSAHRKELLDPEKEILYGTLVTPGAFAYRALNRDSLTSRVARVAVGGHVAGMHVELVASCVLAGAGALVSSDYFAANGTVAVVSERGTMYLFDTDQLESPLCEVQLSTPSAAFLYCHPFLPIVGVLSQCVWGGEELKTTMAGAVARRRRDKSPTLHLMDSHNSSVVRPSVDQADDAIDACVGSPKRGVMGSKQSPTTSQFAPLQRSQDDSGSVPPQLSFPSGATLSAEVQGTLKSGRHVGWHDAGPAALMSGGNVTGALPSGNRATSPSGLYISGSTASEISAASALHSGCLLTLVEYRKDPPPRLLSRAWTGAQPPPPSHRLTQVLQHRMEGAAARYGTYYTFSWKFSSHLELAVGNLEEGALRIVRADRTMEGDAGSDLCDVADEEKREGTAVDGKRGVPALVPSTVFATHTSSYQVVQDYNVRLPLHSLMNVEYVSAATSSLSALNNAAAATEAEFVDGRHGTGGATAEQCQRQTALLGAAVDPRCRLGFSSVSLSQASAAAGVLCRPANPLWAGLAVVSMPRGGRRNKRGHRGDAHRYVGHLDLFDAGRDHGGAFGALYPPGGMGAGDGAAGVMGGVSASSCAADSGGPLLKENLLAVAMRQPFCGDASATGAAHHHRRHTGETGNSSGADSMSSHWLYSSAITSVSTQRSQRQRRCKQREVRRDPRAPAISVPSYAATSTKNEVASAVLITADQRIDLHDALRIGPGNVSCVVVMNAAGEVASVPIEVRAVSAWHEEGSVFVGLGPTLYAADLVSIQGIEQLMRRRYAAGFGLSSVANFAAVKEVGGFGSDDVAMLFSYVATLEAVSLVALSGPVPSLRDLLHTSFVTGCGGAQRELAARVQERFGPAWRAKMAACVWHENLCCLLVLQVLRWLPSSLTEEAGQPWRGIVHPQSLAGTVPVLGENSTNLDIERAVAVEVTHGRCTEAAETLLRFANRSPSYGAMATLLGHPEEAPSMVYNSDPRVCASFCASLTPWLLVVFHCLCGPCEGAPRYQPHGVAAEKGLYDDAASVRTVLPLHLYRHSALPFWDRVALAVVMEAGTMAAFTHVMQDVLLRECNPIQALLLQHGIHFHTYAAMQEIVDCTGDFQLGACLFARVGVLTAAAALAFPFLLDAEVSAAAATAAGTGRTEAASPASGSLELSTISSGYPLYSYRAYGCSPLAYLRSSHRRRGPSQLPSSSGGDDQYSLEDGVTHTAELVLKSVLPPPAQAPREVINGVRMLPHSADAVGVSSSLPPRHILCNAVSLNDAAADNSHGNGDHAGNAAEVDSDAADADVPWVWWAAAYRSFLDDEQAFVRRTTFDVECRQMRSGGFLAHDTAAAPVNVRGADVTSSPVAAVSPEAGDAHVDHYGSGCRSPHSTPPRDAEAAGLRSLSPPPADFVPSSAVQCVTHSVAEAGGGTTRGGSGSGVARGLAAASWSPASAPSAFAGLYGCGAAHVTSAIPPYASAFMKSPQPKLCVCGEQHTGTQLIRSLLSICSTTTTRCCVCLETVRLGSKDVDTAFAWCTSCDHGGHAYHLQSWFRTHRRCPVNGCDCHCDEDSSLY
ncbi:hypothetical protein, conserved [Leishmania tarentolae]|uniref:GATOR2 complex protein MIO zinc-ribbon like domain-containing protein n=1 Tax=Leishmania tarentolae TaxID=5689 RepID=A0A640KIB8_LEITA|nr:hypothetical protein, conserved [Leishmania tarentolae]